MSAKVKKVETWILKDQFGQSQKFLRYLCLSTSFCRSDSFENLKKNLEIFDANFSNKKRKKTTQTIGMVRNH